MLDTILATNTAFDHGKQVLLHGLSHNDNTDKTRETIMARSGIFGRKSASDFMISVGLSRDVIALDTRIVGVLRKSCGFKLSTGRIQASNSLYRRLESELRAVCQKCRTSLAQLDRLLFKYSNMSALDWVLKSGQIGLAV
jgi:thermostable 8-oxoguanine DNA glycosylase